MAQLVGRDGLCDAGFARIANDQLPKRLATQRFSPRRKEERRLSPAPRANGARPGQIRVEIGQGDLAHRHEAALATLAEHTQKTALAVDVSQLEPAELADP